MVAAQFLPAIRKTIEVNEGGDAYQLGFAKKANSGASFGVMQGDMHVQSDARDTMRRVLAAAGAAPDRIDRIVTALTPALPGGNPLSGPDTDFVNAALASAAGRPLVDAMDTRIMGDLLKGVDACIAAAQTRRLAVDPRALLYIAPWINMTGPPDGLISWFEGEEVRGLAPPAPPEVGVDDMERYLKASKYFRENPRNFAHFEESVAAGAKLLPP